MRCCEWKGLIEGNLFAQACQADRCFAPQVNPIAAELAVNPMADARAGASVTATTRDTAQSSGGFSVSALQVKTTAQSRSAWSVIPMAFVAGFLLNFMPCVLPVVGLKLLSFMKQANSDRNRILLMSIAYTAGLLLVMLVLATFAVFAGLAWGERFSSAGFTVTLSAIVLAFGMGFLGVWEIPLPVLAKLFAGTAGEIG